MAGTINSLGIGSGVLTSDVIDQLRANDKKISIDPIDSKLSYNQQEYAAAKLLDSLVSTFKSSMYGLQDSSTFQNRTVSTTGSAATVTATSGVKEQTFSLDVTNLAQSHVMQSGSYLSRTSVAATSNGTLNISIDGSSYDIDYTGGSTLEEIAQAITDTAGSKVDASILQVGTDDFRLVLASKETGTTQQITLSDSGGLGSSFVQPQQHVLQSGTFAAATDTIAAAPGDAGDITLSINGTDYLFAYDDTTTLQQLVDNINTTAGTQISAAVTADFRLELTSVDVGSTNSITFSNTGNLNAALAAPLTTVQDPAGDMVSIQQPENASFLFNGIAIERQKNYIDDLMVGVTITLNEESTSNVTISQDKDYIASELQTVVDNYNNLMRELDNMVNADLDNEKVGIFNGNNSVRSIGREINNILTSVNSSGLSLIDYGIGLNEDGTMTFKRSDFDAKHASNPALTEAFFSGGSYTDDNGKVTELDGIFPKLYDKVGDMLSTNGVVTQLTTNLSNQEKLLQKERERSVAMLDAKYDSLTQRYIAYDAIMSRINNQFSSLQQQIEMAVNSKN